MFLYWTVDLNNKGRKPSYIEITELRLQKLNTLSITSNEGTLNAHSILFTSHFDYMKCSALQLLKTIISNVT